METSADFHHQFSGGTLVGATVEKTNHVEPL